MRLFTNLFLLIAMTTLAVVSCTHEAEAGPDPAPVTASEVLTGP